jgi:hypothetical protein
MRSSRILPVLAAAVLWTSTASAQTAVQGWAVERFYPAPAGAGWLVMDDLDLWGGLGGALSLTTSYAYRSLHPTAAGGGQGQLVIEDQMFVNVGAAITYDRFRVTFDVPGPVWTQGNDGVVAGSAFTAPLVDLGRNPDTISDLRLGVDARIFGDPGSAFRLGGSAQLWIPSGTHPEYDTDGTYRVMAKALVAGDFGGFLYAAHLGVHVRPVDDAPVPDAPRGTELLFGAAFGRRFLLDEGISSFVVGPEVWGATAFNAFFGTEATAFEGLLSGRYEVGSGSADLRVKLGAGGGFVPEFGAPAFRAVLSVELVGRTAGASPTSH